MSVKMKQLMIIFKYIISSGLSFIIDISIFWLINNLFKNIILATIIARIVSSLVNYMINRNVVFKSNESRRKTVVQYYTLVLVQMLISAFSVDFIYTITKFAPSFIKIVVDSIIFVVNFLIQKYLIFKTIKC